MRRGAEPNPTAGACAGRYDGPGVPGPKEATAAHHCLKGVASILMMQFFTKVFVRTSSLLDAL
jgi:hypothetical protein